MQSASLTGVKKEGEHYMAIYMYVNSSSLFLIQFMLTCSMIRFLTLLLLGICPCGVSVVMLSSLVCLLGCRGTLCGDCYDYDVCTVVCIACAYAERV